MFITGLRHGRATKGAYREIATPELTNAEIAAFGIDQQDKLVKWWEAKGSSDPMTRIVKVTWGHYALHAMMERETWHSAQHARQIMHFLEQMDIAPIEPLTADDLAGLPLPEHVWH